MGSSKVAPAENPPSAETTQGVGQSPPAESTVAAEVEGTAADVGKAIVEEAHSILDDIKRATNQAQVHELVDKLRSWIKAHF